MAADIEKSQKHKLMHLSEISLMLDTYDDIFSDFDPRPYSERALSDDFLVEMKRASRDKPSGGISLNMQIPKHEHNSGTEKTIKKRLRDHFKHHHDILHAEIQKLRIQGTLIALIGFVLMGAAMLLGNLGIAPRIVTMALVVLEPSGWFAMWFGFDKIFYTAGSRKPDLVFYEKMMKCDITFLPY
ncbi:MAG: hypothetical protein NTY99_00150 [DPANN group archaeon]|nr:hypothetical protein [DPANN group archaeon]